MLKAGIIVEVQATIGLRTGYVGPQILNFRVFMTPEDTKNDLSSDQAKKQDKLNCIRIRSFGA